MMPKLSSERKPSSSVRDDTKNDVVDHRVSNIVDPEFEMDDDEPSWAAPPSPPKLHSNNYWRLVLLVALGAGVALGYLFFGNHQGAKDQTSKTNLPAGFADLGDCSITTSFDGTKELHLYDDSNVTLFDNAVKVNGKFKRIDGTWRFDDPTKLYTITLDGQDTPYSLIKPSGICILLRGEPTAANLDESWFAATDDGAPDYGPSYEEAHEPH